MEIKTHNEITLTNGELYKILQPILGLPEGGRCMVKMTVSTGCTQPDQPFLGTDSLTISYTTTTPIGQASSSWPRISSSQFDDRSWDDR